jgi:hypothetical protein
VSNAKVGAPTNPSSNVITVKITTIQHASKSMSKNKTNTNGVANHAMLSSKRRETIGITT